MNHQVLIMPSNYPKSSLRTKFALRFLRALKNINDQEIINNYKIITTTHNANEPFMVSQQRYQKVKVAAETSMASAVGPRRAWSRALLSRARARVARRETPVVVRRGWRRTRREKRRTGTRRNQAQAHEQLRRLVPGGEAMDMKKLFDETAHYIKCLSTQVNVMRSIVNYCSSSSSTT